MSLPKSEANTEKPGDGQREGQNSKVMERVRALDTSFELLDSAVPEVHIHMVFLVIPTNRLLYIKSMLTWISVINNQKHM